MLGGVLEDHQGPELPSSTLNWEQGAVNKAMSSFGLLLFKFLGSKFVAVPELGCPPCLRAPLQGIFLQPSGKGFLQAVGCVAEGRGALVSHGGFKIHLVSGVIRSAAYSKGTNVTLLDLS